MSAKSGRTRPSPELVALGEPLLELAANGPGSLGEVNGFVRGWGGDTANTVLAAARLGVAAGYVTRIGADEVGTALLEMWQTEGVDTSQVVIDGGRYTGLYFIGYGSSGHRFAYYRQGSAASMIDADALDEAYIAGAKVLHVSGISQALSAGAATATDTAIGIARAHGVSVSYDANIRPGLASKERLFELFHQAVARTDILFASEGDLVELFGSAAPAVVCDRLGDGRPALIVIKQEERGATLVLGDGAVHHVPGFEVVAVDSTGAGDAFDGGFLAAWLDGADPVAATTFANAVGALTVRSFGAVSALPHRSDVESLLARGSVRR